MEIKRDRFHRGCHCDNPLADRLYRVSCDDHAVCVALELWTARVVGSLARLEPPQSPQIADPPSQLKRGEYSEPLRVKDWTVMSDGMQVDCEADAVRSPNTSGVELYPDDADMFNNELRRSVT